MSINDVKNTRREYPIQRVFIQEIMRLDGRRNPDIRGVNNIGNLKAQFVKISDIIKEQGTENLDEISVAA